MPTDLDKLKNELPAELEERGFVVFHGLSRGDEEKSPILWDTRQHPGHDGFLNAASRLGAKVVVMHARPFEATAIEDLAGEIEAADLPTADRRELERRLKALLPYTGFTATVELSFDHGNQLYMYETNSEFMTEFLDIMNEVETAFYPGPDSFDEGDDNGPGGSFYSRN
jgi:hypothetical protein